MPLCPNRSREDQRNAFNNQTKPRVALQKPSRRNPFRFHSENLLSNGRLGARNRLLYLRLQVQKFPVVFKIVPDQAGAEMLAARVAMSVTYVFSMGYGLSHKTFMGIHLCGTKNAILS